MSATKERVGLDWDNTLAKSVDDIDKFRPSIPSVIVKNVMFAFATALRIGNRQIERAVVERGDSIKLNEEIMKVIAEGRYDFYVSTMNGETEAISKLLRDRKIPIAVLKSVDQVKSDTEVLVDDNIFTALRRNRKGLHTVVWVDEFNSLFAPIARYMGIPTASNSEELAVALGRAFRHQDTHSQEKEFRKSSLEEQFYKSGEQVREVIKSLNNSDPVKEKVAGFWIFSGKRVIVRQGGVEKVVYLPSKHKARYSSNQK